MPENSMPKEVAYQIIHDELQLDGNPRLNLASFVTTWMEPECDKLMIESLSKNYVDMDEYPITTELQVNQFAVIFKPHQPRHYIVMSMQSWRICNMNPIPGVTAFVMSQCCLALETILYWPKLPFSI